MFVAIHTFVALDDFVDRKGNGDGKKEISASPDSFSVYLKEIRRYPLLNEEQEKEVSKRVREGDPEARETLITSNLRLVTSIGRKYAYFSNFHDIIGVGNIGLMRAVEKYDCERGKFSTYANKIIWGWMLRYISEDNSVKIPVHKKNLMKQIGNTIEKLLSEEKEVTDESIHLEINRTRKNKYSLEQISEMMSIDAKVSVTSLDEPRGDDGESNLYDVIGSDAEAESIMLGVEKMTVGRILESKIARLNKNQQIVIIDRFYRCKTLDSIGKALGVTRERIRQIESEALRKLREMLRKDKECRDIGMVEEDLVQKAVKRLQRDLSRS